MILQALEREWRKSPDLRFGQFMVNLVDRNLLNPKNRDPGDTRRALFGMEDGTLLTLLGPETEDEVTYIREEPQKAKEGWKEGLKVYYENRERSKRRSDSGSTDEET